MKTIIVALTLTFFNLLSYSQIIDISLTNTNGSEGIFGKSYGYGITYTQEFKKNKISLQIGHINYNKQYDDIYINLINGQEAHEIILPKNNRYYIKAKYGFKLLNNSLSNICIGPEFSLNYFYLNERYYYSYPTNGVGTTRKEEEINRLGFGAFIEYEVYLNENKKFAFFMLTDIERTNFHEVKLIDDSKYPTSISWIGINLGLRYNFQ